MLIAPAASCARARVMAAVARRAATGRGCERRTEIAANAKYAAARIARAGCRMRRRIRKCEADEEILGHSGVGE